MGKYQSTGKKWGGPPIRNFASRPILFSHTFSAPSPSSKYQSHCITSPESSVPNPLGAVNEMSAKWVLRGPVGFFLSRQGKMENVFPRPLQEGSVLSPSSDDRENEPETEQESRA